MVAVVLTGWALSGVAVLVLIAAEIWIESRAAARSRRPQAPRPPARRPSARRHPASGPTARQLAVLAALPSPRRAESEVGELICLRCDRSVDFDTRLGLFCRECESAAPESGSLQTIGLRCGPADPGPEGTVLELCQDGTTGPT